MGSVRGFSAFTGRLESAVVLHRCDHEGTVHPAARPAVTGGSKQPSLPTGYGNLAAVGLALAGRAGARTAQVFGVSVSRSMRPSARYSPRVAARHAIQRQLGMTYRTVEVLADANAPEDLFRGQWQGYPSVLDEYKPYLVTAPPPSPRTVAGRILRRTNSLTEAEQLCLKAVLVHCPELDALNRHVRFFAETLTERQGQRLPEWLHAVRNDNLPGLHILAAGIDRDRDAVIAGLTLPWSSGVVEGHVNRIKMFKRQMFGRVGFLRLRRRVLLYR